MGAPQVYSPEPIPVEDVQAESPANVEFEPTTVERLESELKAKIAAVESKLQQLESGIRDGLHNRVNEVEKFLQRKYPYG